MKIKQRLLSLKLPNNRSAFLWGPRKTGKSYWITYDFLPSYGIENTALIDLLKTDSFAEYISRPQLLRERFQDSPIQLIVIDEIQKIPSLLDEVHWLIENSQKSFLLTGSSARKLKRSHANMLGGRAWRRQMVPLSYVEISNFKLESALLSGFLPPHLLSPDPREDLRAYVLDYLKEEIAAEAAVRNIPAFSDFLRVAAITSSELLDYTNIASEVGVSAKVVRSYFDLLEDSFLGFRIPPWTKSKNRRMIQTEKFYIFDVGVSNFLAKRNPVIGGSDFGKSFEQFILMELRAYQAYKCPDLPICFWRTAAGQEVDFIVGDKQLAIEVKGSAQVHEKHARHFAALHEDGVVKHSIIVSLKSEPHTFGGKIRVLPWEIFLEELWGGQLV